MKTLARARDKAEIVSRLRALLPERPRRWGRMSAHQMVCHLADSLRMLSDQKAVTLPSTPLRRTLVKWIALYAPMPWPAGIRTTPEMDQELAGTRPAEFAADLAELERLLELVTAEPPARFDGRAHPALGRISGAAWLRWGYLHIDHHLRQFGV